MSIRSFLAFPISGALKERLECILDDLKATGADVKWVKPDHIHLTIKFLGELEENRVESVMSLLKERCREFVPIKSYLIGIGAFPDLQHPKIVWAGLDDPKQEIQGIVEVLRGDMVKLKIAQDEHPFKPHLTLGRVRSSANLKDLVQRIRQITFEGKTEQMFDKIVLYKSTLTPQGPIYDVLREYKIEDRQ
jgi:2'-5' RNA ligase